MDVEIDCIHSGERHFKCGICEKCFGQQNSLKRHIATVHDKKKGLFECDYCGETFSRKPEQEVHLKEIHREVKIN